MSADCWIAVGTRVPVEREEVDLWLHITPSARSFGWSESFRVVEAWRVGDKWLHRHKGKEQEIEADYVTHWMPMPPPPQLPDDASPSPTRLTRRSAVTTPSGSPRPLHERLAREVPEIKAWMPWAGWAANLPGKTVDIAEVEEMWEVGMAAIRAAVNAALDEAARVARAHAIGHEDGCEVLADSGSRVSCSSQIAAAIEALKGDGQPPRQAA